MFAAALLALVIPAAGSAQFSVGLRAGTLGLGGEASIGLGDRLAVRGGIGALPFEYTSDFSGVEYTVKAPSTVWNAGVDFYPFSNGLRLSAGILNRPEFDLSASGQEAVNIGGREYDGDINIEGAVLNDRDMAPYATIGFGRATGPGMGLYADLGVALLGETTVTLVGTCTSNGQPCPEFQTRLQTEADQAEEDVGGILEYHPIINIGFRIGLGGR